MRAVSFNVTVPGFLLGKGLGGVTESVLFGGLSGLRLRDVPEPALPAPDWVRLEVLKAGICGTDVGNLTFSASPAMEPFGSFPAVLGHEVVARVLEVGTRGARGGAGTAGDGGSHDLLHHAGPPRRGALSVLRRRACTAPARAWARRVRSRWKAMGCVAGPRWATTPTCRAGGASA